MITARKHGHQPAQRLGCTVLTYHRKVQPLTLGRANERIGVRVGTRNVGSMSGRGTEVCEELRKRRMDVCCLQEVRWSGQGARFMGEKGRIL